MGMARDSWVPLATGGKGKINSAMVFGGPQAELDTVRSATGLPIEGYVVSASPASPRSSTSRAASPSSSRKTVNASHAGIVIKAGPQTLTGTQALAYARERHTLPDGDFGRSRHQGELILAVGIKAKLAGPIAIPGVLSSASKVVKTNLSAEQVLTYVAGLERLNPTADRARRRQGRLPGGPASSRSSCSGPRPTRLFADFRDGNLS